MDDAFERRTSRAGLLKLGAAAAFVLGAGPAARAVAGNNKPAANTDAATPASGGSVRSPHYLRLSTYVPLVGSAFRIHRSQARPLSVKLVSATRLPSEAGESFSLIFRAHGNAKLGQETYTLEHPRLGEFPLFLVPVGAPLKGQDFQAVVNRIPASWRPRV
jgi:hypothetical protein